jgi:hypothetical protein
MKTRQGKQEAAVALTEEEQRRNEIFEHPPVISEHFLVRLEHALRYRTWGWRTNNCIKLSGISESSFHKYASSVPRNDEDPDVVRNIIRALEAGKPNEPAQAGEEEEEALELPIDPAEQAERDQIFANPPTPSPHLDENMINAILWASWGWRSKDCYEKAGVGKSAFYAHRLLIKNVSPDGVRLLIKNGSPLELHRAVVSYL